MITIILEFTRRESSIWSTWFDPEINRYANEYNGFNKVPDLFFPTAQTYHLSLHQKSIFYTKKTNFLKSRPFSPRKKPKSLIRFFKIAKNPEYFLWNSSAIRLFFPKNCQFRKKTGISKNSGNFWTKMCMLEKLVHFRKLCPFFEKKTSLKNRPIFPHLPHFGKKSNLKKNPIPLNIFPSFFSKLVYLTRKAFYLSFWKKCFWRKNDFYL